MIGVYIREGERGSREEVNTKIVKWKLYFDTRLLEKLAWLVACIESKVWQCYT